MPRFLQSIRPLYLLALFQLVGGPLVLGAVLLLGKLSWEQEPAEHGVVRSVVRALQSEEWKTVAQTLALEEHAIPADQEDTKPVPSKERDTKGKLYTTGLEAPARAPLTLGEKTIRFWCDDLSAVVRPQAPPGPPPRVS